MLIGLNVVGLRCLHKTTADMNLSRKRWGEMLHMRNILYKVKTKSFIHLFVCPFVHLVFLTFYCSSVQFSSYPLCFRLTSFIKYVLSFCRLSSISSVVRLILLSFFSSFVRSFLHSFNLCIYLFIFLMSVIHTMSTVFQLYNGGYITNVSIFELGCHNQC